MLCFDLLFFFSMLILIRGRHGTDAGASQVNYIFDKAAFLRTDPMIAHVIVHHDNDRDLACVDRSFLFTEKCCPTRHPRPTALRWLLWSWWKRDVIKLTVTLKRIIIKITSHCWKSGQRNTHTAATKNNALKLLMKLMKTCWNFAPRNTQEGWWRLLEIVKVLAYLTFTFP